MVGRATKAATPKTAALLFNNLHGNGRSLAYVAYSTAIIVPEGPVLSGGSAVSQAVAIEEPDGVQIQQIRWVTLPQEELLVIASQRSLQLYSPDGQRLIHVVTAKDPGSALAGVGIPSTLTQSLANFGDL